MVEQTVGIVVVIRQMSAVRLRRTFILAFDCKQRKMNNIVSKYVKSCTIIYVVTAEPKRKTYPETVTHDHLSAMLDSNVATMVLLLEAVHYSH